MLGSNVDAEEALSIAMMKLIQCWERKQPELRNPRAWVSIVVKNVCTDIQRQNSKRVTSDLTQNGEDIMPYVEEVKTVDENLPFAPIESRELYEIVMRCLYNLPDTIMSTAIMRFRDDLDYRDIAAVLDIQENTARKRVEYARKLLMKDNELRNLMEMKGQV